jgi:hypothetical protein
LTVSTLRNSASAISRLEAGPANGSSVLFDRFGVGELPQNRKRGELARRAIESGAVAH